MFCIFHTEDIVYLISQEIKSLERVSIHKENADMNLQSVVCRFCSIRTFFLVRKLTRILFFSWLWSIPLCHWPVEHRDHIAFAYTECVWYMCSPRKLIPGGSWCWLSLQDEHTKLITLCNLKEVIFTEKIPSVL